jgi:hypothetical protein
VSLRRAFRTSLTDLYFNSWRLAPANVVWGAGFVVALLAGPLSLLTLALLVLLCVPLAGIHRMAALIARDEPAAFSDFVDGMRCFGRAAIAVGGGAAILAGVFTTNVIIGLGTGEPIGWVLSALALHGLVALAMFLVAFWPILVDPRRAALDLRGRVVLAGLAVIGRPGRMLALTFVVGVILAVSLILFAAILLVSVAYVSLVASRSVLPMVDELEARLPGRVAGLGADPAATVPGKPSVTR